MHIGIVSPCDINAFANYLYEDDRNKLPNNKVFATSVNTLVLEFLNQGYDISIFTIYPIPQDLHLQGDKLQIHVVSEYNIYPWKYLHGCWIDAFRLKGILTNYLNGIDILHAHWTSEYAWAAGNFVDVVPVFCSVRDWVPYIWRIESFKNKVTWTFRYFLFVAIFRNQKINFIANSKYTAELVSKKIKKNNSLIIPNPIKGTLIKKKRQYYPDDCFKIVTISQSNDKRKNIKVLLYAFKQFHSRHLKSSLSLIGPPFVENETKIEKWKRLGLLEGVNLIGAASHEEVIDILDNSSLLVHPSLEETFGNTLLEAMSRRVPVLGGVNSGAVPSVLDYGLAGCLCDVTSVQDIISKLSLIYEDNNYRNSLISNATSLILEKFTDKAIVEKHIEIYQKAINETF